VRHLQSLSEIERLADVAGVVLAAFDMVDARAGNQEHGLRAKLEAFLEIL
jgi:hypothetical protein